MNCDFLCTHGGRVQAVANLTSPLMSSHPNSVSIHPYFKAHPGKLEAAKALLPEFVKISATEPKSLYYDFTVCDDVIFCREAYVGAEGAQAHLANVGALLNELLTLADLVRLEIHGPAAELDKLKDSLAGLNPAYFIHDCGVVK